MQYERMITSYYRSGI